MRILNETIMRRATADIVGALDAIHSEGDAGAGNYDLAGKIEERTGLYPVVDIFRPALAALEQKGIIASNVPEGKNNKVYRMAIDSRNLKF